jgi:hypothetical protein
LLRQWRQQPEAVGLLLGQQRCRLSQRQHSAAGIT